MGFYDKWVVPRLINCACATKPVRRQREKVVPQASGTVLEVGIGTGLNLPYYDTSRVDRLIGLDPSEESWELAGQRAEALSIPVEFIGLPGEEIPLDENSVDTVLVTFSLCTIPEPVLALEGMRRVLKPSGKLLFAEHGRAPDAGIARWQDRLDGVWATIAGGCHLNRDVPQLLERGGFSIDSLQTMYLPGTPRVAAFNYWGQALPV